MPDPAPPAKKSLLARSSAAAVAAGILLSRLFGLVRDRIFAHYLGNSDAADVFRAAFRIPNMLQNLFGEGVLSASFIPIYARLRAQENHEEAERLAEAIFAILFLTASVFALLGILATPLLIDLIAPGFHGAKRELTVHLVRIFFPGAALLVLSAWCLGILNSHRKFLLSYSAPVIVNICIIAAFLWRGGTIDDVRLATFVAYSSVLGSGLQFAIQLPSVLALLRPLRLEFALRGPHVRSVVRNFFPVFFSRGVVQISSTIDSVIASFLGTGGVSAFTYAQTINTLPVSLFGMAISAAEIPAMSSVIGSDDEVAAVLRTRLLHGLRKIAFFVIPSAVGFVVLGNVIVSTIYRSGRFNADDVNFVWSVLAGSGVGLLASTSGRLYSSAFYSLRDTRTPLRFAILRVTLTVALGWFFALPLPRMLGISPRWGVAGLTLSAGIAGWVEFALLRRALHARIGVVPADGARTAKLWTSAVLAALAAFAIERVLPIHRALIAGPVILAAYAALYGLAATLFRVEAPGALNRIQRRIRTF